MQVYSGWPQLVRIRSSTTWYVAILGSWVEKKEVKSIGALSPHWQQAGRCHRSGQAPCPGASETWTSQLLSSDPRGVSSWWAKGLQGPPTGATPRGHRRKAVWLSTGQFIPTDNPQELWAAAALPARSLLLWVDVGEESLFFE